jgi:PKD repeat protein
MLEAARFALAVVAVVGAVTGCYSPTANRLPVAAFDAAPRDGYAPLDVRFNANLTYDPDGDGLRFEWTFGDGATGTGRATDHTYGEGSYTVLLRAIDSHGGEGVATTTIAARAVPEGYFVKRFEWTYNGDRQAWDVLIPYNLYQTYRGRLRDPLVENYAYAEFVLDPLDDPTLEDLAAALGSRARKTDEAFIEYTLAFVQGAITYRPDSAGAEWPLYPVETLADGAGDCEDTAILFVSLLRARGIPSKLAFVDTDDDATPDHVAALVSVSETYIDGLACGVGQSVTILTFDDGLHVLAETAAQAGPIPLGCDPWGLDAVDVIEWWSL